MTKSEQYAKKVALQIADIFEKDCENYISKEELAEGNNLTDFIHAVSTLAPAVIYHSLTGAKINSLQFNHLANRLVFQYSEMKPAQSNAK